MKKFNKTKQIEKKGGKNKRENRDTLVKEDGFPIYLVINTHEYFEETGI